MSRERVEVIVGVTANLDMIPGWGYYPLDWVDMIRTRLEASAGSYDVQVNVLSVKSPRKDPTKWVIGHQHRTGVLYDAANGCWVGMMPEETDMGLVLPTYTTFTSDQRIKGIRLPEHGCWVKVAG